MRTARIIVIGLVAIALMTGCSGQQAGPTPAATAEPTLAPAAVTVEAHGETGGTTFSPATIEIASGAIVRVVDVGDTNHDLTIDVGGKVPTKPADQHFAVQIKVDLAKTTNQAAITLPPGTYSFYCSVALGSGAGHAVNGMVGTITVR